MLTVELTYMLYIYYYTFRTGEHKGFGCVFYEAIKNEIK